MMTLGELAGKIDVNIPLYIGALETGEIVFTRKHVYDVIPEDLLRLEIETIQTIFPRKNEAMYITVRTRLSIKKLRLGELLNYIGNDEHVDVSTIDSDGTKEKVYSDFEAYIIDEEYDDYLVKEVKVYKSKYGYAVIDIVII